MVNWKAAIDQAANDFRYWYSFVALPTDVANITISILESFYLKITRAIVNSTIGDLLGTEKIEEMTIASFIFILIFRLDVTYCMQHRLFKNLKQF